MDEATLLRACQIADALNAKSHVLRRERYAPYYLKALDDGAEMLRDLVLFVREQGTLPAKPQRCPRCYQRTETIDGRVGCSRRKQCGWKSFIRGEVRSMEKNHEGAVEEQTDKPVDQQGTEGAGQTESKPAETKPAAEGD